MARGGRRRGETCPRCGGRDWHEKGDRRWCRDCNKRRSLATNTRRRLDAAHALWVGAKHRAAQNRTEFRITVDDIRAVWPANNRCPALGIPLVRGRNHRAGDGSPTLDRLNNAWGYEPGNIAVISHAANRTKSNLRAQDLEAIAAWMRSQGLD